MNELKRRILYLSYKLRLSHIGSCLTAVNIIDEIYKIKKPNERFVLSAGHSHLAHAVVIEKYGIIKDAEKNIVKHGIHCERAGGCDVSTGSLGQGLPISVGIALADRSKNVYCLISDGECAEGSIFEAFRIVEEQELWNLKIYLNHNRWAAYQSTDKYWLPKIGPSFKHIDTNFDELMPVLREPQEAHYKILSKEEYEKIIR